MSDSVISRGGVEERFHTLLPDPADPVSSLLSRLEAALGESPGEVLEIRANAYFREVKAVQAPYLAGSSS